jgi:RNA polymerase sigma-70 factor (ECF subfamily)
MHGRPLTLAGLFHEHGHGHGAASPDDGELEAALRRLFEEGERAWPGLALSPEAFVRHLASRRELPDDLAVVRAADLYLACACASRVRGAVEAFDRAHLGKLDRYLARLRPSPSFVDEVRQVLGEKLFVGSGGAPPKIGEYDGEGALESWVRVIALRAAIDLQRQGGAVAPDERGRDEPATGDPEIGYLKERYRHAFSAAFRGAVEALGAEDRELLRLRFVDGLTQVEVAARLGVHRATVVRRLDAAQEAVTGGARRLLRAQLGATEDELKSLAGVMRSQIELSLPGLLKER